MRARVTNTLQTDARHGRYNPCRLENRTGQGRLGNGLKTAVASRDGLAACGPRARDGLFGFTTRKTQRDLWVNCSGARTIRDSRAARLRALAGNAASDRPSTERTAHKAGRPPAGGRLSFRLSARSHADQELRAVFERTLAEEELIDGRLDQRRELTDFVVEQLAAQLDFAVFIQRRDQ